MFTQWQLGHATETTAVIVARCTEAGTLTLSVNGGVFTGTVINPAVNDGVGSITATGLVAGNNYSFTLTCGDSEVSNILKTMPATGNVRFAFFSCFDWRRQMLSLPQLLENLDVHAAIHQGDMFYPGTTGTAFGETGTAITTTALATDPDSYHTLIRQGLNNPSQGRSAQVCPTYFQMDDHQWPGNDWDNSVGRAQAGGSAITDLPGVYGSNQLAVDAIWETGADVRDIWFTPGMPVNSDAGVVAQKPNEADASTPASNYPPSYSRFTIAGLVEFFILDCISHRNAAVDAETSAKEMLGTIQAQWLKDRLEASTAIYKVIVSSKKTYPSNNDNGDGWNAYTNRRADMLTWIKANNASFTVPGGVFWIAGDRHAADVAYDSTNEHLCVCACPCSVDLIDDTGAGYNTNIIWKVTGSPAQHPKIPNRHAFGFVEANEDYAEISVRGSLGEVLWSGRIAAGSNVLTYPELKIAI